MDETTWDDLELLLGIKLALMSELDSVVVDAGPYYVQAGTQPGVMRIEAQSNLRLEGEARLSPGQELALVELGFSPPGPSEYDENFYAFIDPDDIDAGTALWIGALRDVYGIHPQQVTI